jgi:hypothetical protein
MILTGLCKNQSDLNRIKRNERNLFENIYFRNFIECSTFIKSLTKQTKWSLTSRFMLDNRFSLSIFFEQYRNHKISMKSRMLLAAVFIRYAVVRVRSFI